MISKKSTGNICITEVRSRSHCCRGKAITIIHSECVSLALIINHVKNMRLVRPLYVVCLPLPHFYTLFKKRLDILKKLLNIKCVF